VELTKNDSIIIVELSYDHSIGNLEGNIFKHVFFEFNGEKESIQISQLLNLELNSFFDKAIAYVFNNYY
jgi:hypothetical protein